jgi:hypothetical protein
VVKSAFCFAHGSTGYGGIVVMRLDLNAGDRGFESRFGLYFFFCPTYKDQFYVFFEFGWFEYC